MATQLSKFCNGLLTTVALLGVGLPFSGVLSSKAAMAQQAPLQQVLPQQSPVQQPPIQQVLAQQTPELQSLSLLLQFFQSLHTRHHNHSQTPQNQAPPNLTPGDLPPQTQTPPNLTPDPSQNQTPPNLAPDDLPSETQIPQNPTLQN